MKRLWVLLMVCAMVLSLCAGCSNSSSDSSSDEEASEDETSEDEDESSEEESEDEDLYYNTTDYPIVDEEITVTVTGEQPDGLTDWTNLAVVEEYATRLGIRLDCNFYDSEAWSTQLTLMVASDDLPDLVVNASLNVSDLITWGDEGFFLDLNEYIDLMPNMVTYFEEYPDLESFMTTTEGHIYGISRISTDLSDRIARTFLNLIWLDNVGLEVPTSLDELYETLVAFYEQDANGNGDDSDEIPYLYHSACVASESTIMNAFGIKVQSSEEEGNTYILQATSDGEVVLANTTEEYRAYITFMAQLYEEGLMEQEAFTLSADEAVARLQSDLYGFFGCNAAPFVALNQDISVDADWACIVSLTSEYNENGDFAVCTAVDSDMMLAVSATTEYPEAICRFLDYFYTEEGMYAASSGYEGVTFDFVYDETLGVYVDEIYCPDGYENSEDFRLEAAIFNGCFNVVESNPERDVLFTLDDETLQSEEIMNSWGWASQMAQAYQDAVESGASVLDGYPQVSYTTEQAETRSLYYTDILTYLQTSKAQFINGEMDPETDWDTYLSNLESMGLSSLLEVEQEAYNNYLSVVSE